MFKIDILYYVQLFLNYTWTILFFYLKWRIFSLFWLLLLIGINIVLTYYLIKKKKISGYLFIPYLLWLIFATYLNIEIIILN